MKHGHCEGLTLYGLVDIILINMSQGTEDKLTLEFSVSELDHRIDARELTEAIYGDIVTKVDERDILGVQIYPKKWPRKVQILCKHLPAKECLLIQGLSIYGRHIELHEPGQGLIKITIEDAPLDMSNETLKDWVSGYGTVVELRNEHVLIDGRRTSWRTGTRYAYVMNLREAVPPVMSFNHDGNKVTITAWHYGQTHMKCRWCHEVVEKGHECDRKPKRRCHYCGSSEHIKTDCTVGKLCYKCHKGDHIARDCPGPSHGGMRDAGFTLGDITPIQTTSSTRALPMEQTAGVMRRDETSSEDNMNAVTCKQSDATAVPDAEPGDASDSDASACLTAGATGLTDTERTADDHDSDIIGDIETDHDGSTHRITMNAILIGGSNCRDIPLDSDDHIELNIERLIQGGISVAEAHEKLDECSAEILDSTEAVIIHVGTCDFPVNDVTEMEDMHTKYKELVETVSNSCPNAQLLVSSVLPRCGKANLNEQINNFNKSLAQLAHEYDKVMFVDNQVHFCDHDGEVIEKLYKAKDKTGVHINEQGKLRLSASFQEALKEALYKIKFEMEFSMRTHDN